MPPPVDPPRLFVTTKAAVWRGRRLLLLRELEPDGTIVYDLPGGRLELAEAPTDGLRRELREELGVEALSIGTLPIRVWATVNPAGIGVVGLLFDVELPEQQFDHRKSPEGILAAEYLDPEELAASDVPVCEVNRELILDLVASAVPRER